MLEQNLSNIPRFEFRSFGEDFFDIKKTILDNLNPDNIESKQTEEIYIISPFNNKYNIKIRFDRLDIKILEEKIHNIEKWNLLTKIEFPIWKEVFLNYLFPALNIKSIVELEDSYNIEQFLWLIEKSYKNIVCVKVKKNYTRYVFNNISFEYANIYLLDKNIHSINIESESIEDVKSFAKKFNLNGLENINYIQAIKRVVGMR